MDGVGEGDEVRAGFPGVIAVVVVEDGEFAFLRVAVGAGDCCGAVLCGEDGMVGVEVIGGEIGVVAPADVGFVEVRVFVCGLSRGGGEVAEFDGRASVSIFSEHDDGVDLVCEEVELTVFFREVLNVGGVNVGEVGKVEQFHEHLGTGVWVLI